MCLSLEQPTLNMSPTPSTNSLLSALRGGSFFIMLVLAVGALATLCSLGANAYVEIVWHTQVGYSSVYAARTIGILGSQGRLR